MNAAFVARFLLALAMVFAAADASATRAWDFGEQFHLDSLHYVGLEEDIVRTEAGKPPRAILRSACGAEFEVEVGSFIGKDYGKIVRIDAHEIVLVELVPNGEGGWLEREARLALESGWRARPHVPKPQP